MTQFRASRTAMTLAAMVLLSTASVLAPATAASVPKFKEYPAALYTGKRAPLRLVGDDRTFRTRLSEAYASEINFGGRYILTAWGCGTECLMGAAIDTTNGRVVWIPFSLCCFGDTLDDDFEPLIGNVDSRLAVFTGVRDERGALETWFYERRGGRWVLRGHVQRTELPA